MNPAPGLVQIPRCGIWGKSTRNEALPGAPYSTERLLELIENEGIRLEEIVMQSKGTSLNGAGLSLAADETIDRPTDRCRFLLLEPDLMRPRGGTIGQRPPKGRVEAE